LSLGLLNYRQNDFTGAIAHLDRVLQGGQADPANMMILAESYKNVDQFQKAEEVLAQIIDQDPGNEEARISLGRLDLRMGKIEEGYLLLDKIAEDHLRDNEVRAGLELLNEVRMAAPGFMRSTGGWLICTARSAMKQRPEKPRSRSRRYSSSGVNGKRPRMPIRVSWRRIRAMKRPAGDWKR